MTKIMMRAGVLAAAIAMALPGAALAKKGDRDNDKMPDKWEVKHGLKVTKNDARKDADHDGLTNLKEFRAKTDPQNADTDNDGLDDGDEVNTNNNPHDGDSDNDGVRDGNEVNGTIASYDTATKTLTINLAGPGGGTLTGQVTDSTRIKCEDSSDVSKSSEGSGHGSGDNGNDDGPNHDAGDDHGDSNGNGQACTTANLTAGTPVHEAETELVNGQTVFDKVELAPKPAA
ncbi:MAG: hypothetical protein QOE06_1390 [Thermoleophilaceae bacterium]|jgi:hypothetical protein|nr:hypothetical protein [Thermoleophilaceae bacterium]